MLLCWGTVGGFLEEEASELSRKDGYLMGRAGRGRQGTVRGPGSSDSLGEPPAPAPTPISAHRLPARQDDLARIALNC